MKLIRENSLILVVLSIAILIGIKAFTIPGLYTSHDGETHTARLANYYLAIKEGQYPPALAPTLDGGLGDPIFVFIYPIPYLIGAAFHAIGFHYTDSLELTMAIGQWFSGVIFYLFLKLETRKTWPSLIGALFFTWAPYRYLMLFVRGAFAESFSYLFIATSFLCLNRLVHHQNLKWLGFTSLSLAGLLLSHQLSAIMFLPLLTWYFIFKLISTKHRIKTSFFALAALVLAFAIAAFIYLPAFFERHYLQFDQALNYTLEHFVTIKQLIRSPWSYGFSMPGSDHDDMSFQIGLTQLAAVGFAVIFLLFRLVKFKLRIFKDPDTVWLIAWLMPFFIAAGLMIEHPINHYLWQHLPGLNFIDFPWRLLGVCVTAAALVATYLVKLKPNFFIYAFFLFFIFYANRNHLRINEPLIRDDNYFNNYPASATYRNEFQTKWRNTNRWEGIDGEYHFSGTTPETKILVNHTQELVLDVNASSSATLVIHRLYFPGWQLYLDGQSQTFGQSNFSITSSTNTFNGVDTSGFIQTDIPLGHHLVKAVFTPTPLRHTGLILSLIGLILTLSLVFISPLTNPKTFTRSH